MKSSPQHREITPPSLYGFQSFFRQAVSNPSFFKDFSRRKRLLEAPQKALVLLVVVGIDSGLRRVRNSSAILKGKVTGHSCIVDLFIE